MSLRLLVSTFLALTSSLALFPAAADAKPSATHDAALAKVAKLYPKCAKTPSSEDVDGAKIAHKAAQQFFARGEFDRAISYWGDAYAFDCSVPQVFLALAGAYDGAGDPWTAVALVELYRARDPNADKAEIEKKIAEYTEKAPKPANPLEKPSSSAKPSGTSDASTTESAIPEEETSAPFGPVPWITFSVGAAALGAGIVVVAVGVVKVGDADEACPTRVGCTPEVESLGNEGNTLALAGGITAGVGGALAIGSLIWQFAANGEEPRESDPGVSWTIAPFPEGAYAGVRGAF